MQELTVHIPHQSQHAEQLKQLLVNEHFCSRLFNQDATLWGQSAAAEAAIRLGWTSFFDTANDLIDDITQLREQFSKKSLHRIVLCGMGGSSLAPAVITQWSGVHLTVLDSTHPETVRRVITQDLERTAVVISSKSGTTVETRSHLTAFETAFRAAGIDANDRVVIVTDPGSDLDSLARIDGKRVFNADPNIGGRFSALSAFGLVPAGLAGANIRQLVDDAEAQRAMLLTDHALNPAIDIAAEIAAGLERRFVLAIDTDPTAQWGLDKWIEQLIAESTGKQGKGVLPISLPEQAYETIHQLPQVTRVYLTGPDRHLPPSNSADITVSGSLGGQLLTWEVATAALGRLMSVDPFNQPDVESAKIAARASLRNAQTLEGNTVQAPTTPTATDIIAFVEHATLSDGYLALQVFLDPDPKTMQHFAELREALARHVTVPVALGWGPSYLHSTGQLHKGGPEKGVFLQFVDSEMTEYPVGDSDVGFAEIIRSQSDGDATVLRDRGRPVMRIATGNHSDLIAELLRSL